MQPLRHRINPQTFVITLRQIAKHLEIQQERILNWEKWHNVLTPAREHLMSIVQTVLKQSGKEESPSTETLNRPWAIARILPDARHYIVARFVNRQDANDHVRFLQRFIPAAKFEIVFDIPDENE